MKEPESSTQRHRLNQEKKKEKVNLQISVPPEKENQTPPQTPPGFSETADTRIQITHERGGSVYKLKKTFVVWMEVIPVDARTN